MGIGAYVYLLKIAETEDYVQYSFGPKEDSLGRIKLYKETELFEVNDIPDDPNSNCRLYIKRLFFC